MSTEQLKYSGNEFHSLLCQNQIKFLPCASYVHLENNLIQSVDRPESSVTETAPTCLCKLTSIMNPFLSLLSAQPFPIPRMHTINSNNRAVRLQMHRTEFY